jgi:hypothetical protein
VNGDKATIKRNRADANGFVEGASDGVGRGISNINFTTPPTGQSTAHGNDNSAECDPLNLCK